jgi:hypothetical protein
MFNRLHAVVSTPRILQSVFLSSAVYCRHNHDLDDDAPARRHGLGYCYCRRHSFKMTPPPLLWLWTTLPLTPGLRMTPRSSPWPYMDVFVVAIALDDAIVVSMALDITETIAMTIDSIGVVAVALDDGHRRCHGPG